MNTTRDQLGDASPSSPSIAEVLGNVFVAGVVAHETGKTQRAALKLSQPSSSSLFFSAPDDSAAGSSGDGASKSFMSRYGGMLLTAGGVAAVLLFLSGHKPSR